MAKPRPAQPSDFGVHCHAHRSLQGSSEDAFRRNKMGGKKRSTKQGSRASQGADTDGAMDEEEDGGEEGHSAAPSTSSEEPDGDAPLSASRISQKTNVRLAGLFSGGDIGVSTDGSTTPTGPGAEESADEDTEIFTQFTEDAPMSDVSEYEAKINELQSSGWQPSQELGSAVDDDDYGELEQMSQDGDDDKQGIKDHEMKELEREYETEHQQSATAGVSEMNVQEDEALARRLSLDSAGSGPSDLDLVFNQDMDPWGGLTPLDEPYMELWNIAESGLWRMPEITRSSENSEQSNGTQKRVRFEDQTAASSSSSSDDSEDEDDIFPDLFLAQDQLDPLYLHAIDNELDEDFHVDDASDAGSFWDFDADERIALAADEEDGSSDSSSSADSDDEGDTTDEEMPPVVLAKIAQRSQTTPARPPGSAARTQSSLRKPVVGQGKKTTPNRLNTPRGPKAGTFSLDPTRATIKVTPNGKIETLPPRQPAAKDRAFWERVARSRRNSRNSSPHSSQQFDMDNGNPIVPFFTARSTLGTMFDGNLEYLRNDSNDHIANAMLPPSTGLGISTLIPTDYDSDMDYSADPTAFDELIDLGDSDSEDEEETAQESDAVLSPSGTVPFAQFGGPMSPNRPDTAGSDLLAHLDRNRDAVGSFRRNQHNAKHLGSLPSHPALRASASEKNALQTGRRAAANLPMTPARKRIGKTAGARASPISSPLSKQSPKRRERRRSSLGGGFVGRR